MDKIEQGKRGQDHPSNGHQSADPGRFIWSCLPGIGSTGLVDTLLVNGLQAFTHDVHGRRTSPEVNLMTCDALVGPSTVRVLHSESPLLPPRFRGSWLSP